MQIRYVSQCAGMCISMQLASLSNMMVHTIVHTMFHVTYLCVCKSSLQCFQPNIPKFLLMYFKTLFVLVCYYHFKTLNLLFVREEVTSSFRASSFLFLRISFYSQILFTTSTTDSYASTHMYLLLLMYAYIHTYTYFRHQRSDSIIFLCNCVSIIVLTASYNFNQNCNFAHYRECAQIVRTLSCNF